MSVFMAIAEFHVIGFLFFQVILQTTIYVVSVIRVQAYHQGPQRERQRSEGAGQKVAEDRTDKATPGKFKPN